MSVQNLWRENMSLGNWECRVRQNPAVCLKEGRAKSGKGLCSVCPRQVSPCPVTWDPGGILIKANNPKQNKGEPGRGLKGVQ